MSYIEWLATGNGARWYNAVKTFLRNKVDLDTVIHITRDVFEAGRSSTTAVRDKGRRDAQLVRGKLISPVAIFHAQQVPLMEVARWNEQLEELARLMESE